MRRPLTSKVVENLKPAPLRRVELRDALLPGFGVRVTVNGRKSWFAVGRVQGRQVRHTIGTYPVVSLADARAAAQTIIGQMQLGTYAAHSTEPAPLTFEVAAADFIAKYARPKNRDWQHTESVLRKFMCLNSKLLKDIKRADIVKVLDEMIIAGTPIRANRALAAAKKMFAWALDRGLVDVHPIVGLKPPGKETRRDRIFTDYEIRAFWAASEGLGYPFGPAVQLFLLTGQRRGEITSMRWSDIDFARKIWTIPAAIAKNGRVHEVPLSAPVLDLLTSLPRFAGSGLVFTTTGRTPVSGFGRVKYRLDEIMGVSDWRFHDLRRTAASGMARLGVPPHVIEKVLNHVSGQISGVAAIYNRHGYEAEKREALEKWAGKILSVGEFG